MAIIAGTSCKTMCARVAYFGNTTGWWTLAITHFDKFLQFCKLHAELSPDDFTALPVLEAVSYYHPGQKQKDHPQDPRQEEHSRFDLVISCLITSDQCRISAVIFFFHRPLVQGKVIHDCPRLLPCADSA